MQEIAAVILENEQGEILLYLRDDKPGLPFPAHWDLFGGHIEPGETPEAALEREVKEELGIELPSYRFLKTVPCLTGDVRPNIKHVFHAVLRQPAEELTLHEGQRLQYFPRHELAQLKFANILKDIVLEFIRENPAPQPGGE